MHVASVDTPESLDLSYLDSSSLLIEINTVP